MKSRWDFLVFSHLLQEEAGVGGQEGEEEGEGVRGVLRLRGRIEEGVGGRRGSGLGQGEELVEPLPVYATGVLVDEDFDEEDFQFCFGSWEVSFERGGLLLWWGELTFRTIDSILPSVPQNLPQNKRISPLHQPKLRVDAQRHPLQDRQRPDDDGEEGRSLKLQDVLGGDGVELGLEATDGGTKNGTGH